MASTADPGDYSAKDIPFLASELARRNAENYSRTAAEMHRHHNHETAKLFEFLAQEERAHENAVLERQKKEPGAVKDASPRPLPLEIGLAQEPSYPFYISTYDGACYALQNTKKAFDFFTCLSSQVRDKNVRDAAEFFAKEIVSYIAILRLERIRANRDLREYRQGLGWWRDPAEIGEIEDLEQCFAAMEAALAPLYGRAMKIFKVAGNIDAANCLKRYAGEAFCYHIFHDIQVENFPSSDPDGQEDLIDVLLDTLKVTNQALEFAFLIAETATDNEVLMAATAMAEKLSERLKMISQIIKGLVEAS